MSNSLRVIVRLTSSIYFSATGSLVLTKKLTLLKRLSTGTIQDLVQDLECDSIDLLESLEDGVYEITTYNPQYDWELGVCDGYDLKLVAYSKNNSYSEGKRILHIT
jgi:hypothetical protein